MEYNRYEHMGVKVEIEVSLYEQAKEIGCDIDAEVKKAIERNFEDFKGQETITISNLVFKPSGE